MSIKDSSEPDIKNLKEKCGIAAVFTQTSFAPQLVRRASIALQHRGQESSGIAIYCEPSGFKKRLRVFGKNGYIKVHIGMGLISEVLTDNLIKSLGPSNAAIAHNRYSTTGGSSLMNAHPISQKSKKFRIALGHNGNIPDVSWLKSQVKNHPHAESDTALMAALLAEQRPKYKSWEETFINVLPKIKGAFSLVVLTEDGCIYGIRDPWGIRPLCLGELEEGWIIASESVALDVVGANFIRDIKNGEIIKIDPNGNLTSYFYGSPKRQQLCLLEHIYFSRPDSFINGKRIKALREKCGRVLAKRLKQKGIKPDIVVPIFNSGYFAAKGAAEELGIPLVDAVVTSGYFGRTFISPGQELRTKAVAGKHNVIPDEVYGKKVVFVDDSAIRFTTSPKIVQGLRQAGASEVYAAFASPPVVNQCDLGIAMHTKKELPASKYEHRPIEVIEEKMKQLIKVDQLTYLPLEDTCRAMKGEVKDFYAYPFGGRHPVRDAQEVFPTRQKTRGSTKVMVVSRTKNNRQALTGQLAGFNLQIDFTFGSENILKKARQLDPDVLLIFNSDKKLTEEELKNFKKMDITILQFVPSLVSNYSKYTARTSRGEIPVILKNDPIKYAFKKKLPVGGVSVFQLLPEFQNGLGPVIIKEEVRINGRSFEEFKKKIKEAEKRVIINALKRVGHVLSYGIKASGGEFPW